MFSLASDEGQDIIEYALVLPFLLLLIFGIVEFGLILMDFNTITNAAREGARAGIISPNASCDDACVETRIVTAARQLTTGLDQGALQIVVQYPSSNNVEVQVDYAAQLITGPIISVLGGKTEIPLHAVASMQLE